MNIALKAPDGKDVLHSTDDISLKCAFRLHGIDDMVLYGVPDNEVEEIKSIASDRGLKVQEVPPGVFLGHLNWG